MELKQLQYFLATADSGSMSETATILDIAQPALSRQIRALETELGLPLFYRHGRGVRLTDDGERFYAAVSPPIRELEQAKAELIGHATVLSGTITFGMPPSISTAIGARLVEAFLRRFPQVKLHLVDGFSGHVNEWLVGGRLDMAVINNARRNANIRMDPLLSVDLYFVAHRSATTDATAGDTTIPFRRVLEHPLVLPGRHHGLRRQLDATAMKLEVELNIIVEIDALAALKELVRAGVAATVLPHGTIADMSTDPDIVVRRVVEPEIANQFMVAYSLQRPTTPAMRELARSVRTEVRHALADGRLVGRV